MHSLSVTHVVIEPDEHDPPVFLQKLFVGIDLGGTTLNVGVLDDAGVVLSSSERNLSSRNITPEETIRMMISLIEDVRNPSSFTLTLTLRM